jgi:signal transduction histidine kinase
VDYASTLRKVARLAVPFFADWCVVDMAEPDGSLRRLAVAHVDPAKVQLADELQQRYPPDRHDAHGPYQVLRTGEPEMMQEIDYSGLMMSTRDKEYLRILQGLGLKCYMCVPIRALDKLLGVFTFVSAESGRRYGPGDLRLAEDLAYRAAIAIENARLYGELQDADRRKDEFLATLAHELRNPLAPLRNALELLRRVDGDAALMEKARSMMERQLGQMVRLIDDLLDISRITRGKLQLRKERVELAAVLQRTNISAVRIFWM